jgi:hypothetical protein
VRLWVEPVAPGRETGSFFGPFRDEERACPLSAEVTASSTEYSVLSTRRRVGTAHRDAADCGGQCLPYKDSLGNEGPWAADRRLTVQWLHGRGGTGGGSVEVQLSHETHPVHLDSQLAAPAARGRAAGA